MEGLRKVFIQAFIMIIFMVSHAYGEEEFFKKGDIIEFGNYNNEPILWQVVHIDENGNPLLFSKRILTIKAFDASGDKHEHDGYYGFSRYYGSNNWEISTIRQWLNSNKKSIDWDYNPPSPENIFNGENPYAEEKGFLHRDNFTKSEEDIILKHKYKYNEEEILEDRVFLLSVEELNMYTLDEILYPLQIPTITSIKESDYKGSSLSSGKQYPILTRDLVENAPHAVKVFSENQMESYQVANAGRVGVSPAMYLDISKIDRSLISGTGIGSDPYKLNLKSNNNIILFLILIIVILILYRLFKLKRLRSTLILILILLLSMGNLTSCKEKSKEVNEYIYDDEYEPYLVVLQYAKNIDLINKRIEKLYEGEGIVVISQYGSNKTREILEIFDKPTSPDDYKEIIDYIYSRNWIIGRKGDYRVTNIKKEIDDVYNGISSVVPRSKPIISEETDLTDKMILDTEEFYNLGDYYSIESYLMDNDLIILHPYDIAPLGIGLLYSDINY